MGISLNSNIDYVPLTQVSYSAEMPSQTTEFCATDTTLNELRIGNTEYSFLREVKIYGIWKSETNEWICWSPELGHTFIGKNDSFVSALDDFKNQLHVIFQRLYGKRPFEMDMQEKEQWNKLINIIDVNHYKTTTPMILREIGLVSYGMISRPYSIRWLTGYNYIIDISKVPAELMALKPGRYIEAVVKRDSVTHKEIEILSMQAISFHLPNEEEAKKIWDDMPVAKLTEGKWD